MLGFVSNRLMTLEAESLCGGAPGGIGIESRWFPGFGLVWASPIFLDREVPHYGLDVPHRIGHARLVF